MVRYAVIAILLPVSSGCLNPYSTRLPGPNFEAVQVQRRRAEVVDPYPDRLAGPDTGHRPIGFAYNRSEPLRAKRRYYEVDSGLSIFFNRQRELQYNLPGLAPAAAFPGGPPPVAYAPDGFPVYDLTAHPGAVPR